MYGVAADTREYKTAVVKDNGFNPSWNEVHYTLNLLKPEEFPFPCNCSGTSTFINTSGQCKDWR